MLSSLAVSSNLTAYLLKLENFKIH